MIDFAMLEPPGSPNTYLVCNEEICRSAAADKASPVFDAPAEAVRDAWMKVVDGAPRTTRTDADEDALQYEFVQRSRLFRFPDTITVRFVPLDEARSTIAVYSRSKYGHSDLGVNKKRVEDWLSALGAELQGV